MTDRYPNAMTTKQAAEYTGLAKATLETRRCRGGGPPYVKLGGRRGSAIRYLRSDLDQWLEARRFRNTAEAQVAEGAQ